MGRSFFHSVIDVAKKVMCLDHHIIMSLQGQVFSGGISCSDVVSMLVEQRKLTPGAVISSKVFNNWEYGAYYGDF